MIKPKVICEEENLDCDFGRMDFNSRFQTNNFESIQENNNGNQQFLNENTITVDEQYNKGIFQFENQELTMCFNQPKLTQKNYQNDSNEDNQINQPRISVNKKHQNAKEISELNEKSTEFQNVIKCKQTIEKEEIEDCINQYVPNIQKYGKSFAQMPSVDELDIEIKLQDSINQQLISNTQQNRNILGNSLELENNNFNNFQNIIQKNQIIDQTLENELSVENINTIQNLNNQCTQIDFENIHGKQFQEEEKQFEKNENDTYNYKNYKINLQIYDLRGDNNLDCFMPAFEQRRPSLSQYCDKRQKTNENNNNFDYDQTSKQIEVKSYDLYKNELQESNKLSKSRDDENFEGQDTNDTNVSEIESGKQAYQFNISSSSQSNIQRNSNISGQDNIKIQSDEALDNMGGMSQFDAINQREEILGETATVQIEVGNEQILNFQLDLVDQNSSIQSATRRRINSFNRNNQLFNRISVNSNDIELQMSENQPQPLRRQNAFVDRQSSSLFTHQNAQQNFLTQSNQTQSETEEQVANALREAFNQEDLEIDEHILSMQQPQLMRGGFSRVNVLESQPEIIRQNSTFQNQINGTVIVNEPQTIEQLFFQQIDQIRNGTTSNMQNQDLTFAHIQNNQDLHENMEIPQLRREIETIMPDREPILNPFERYDLARSEEAERRRRIQELELTNKDYQSAERLIEDSQQPLAIDFEKLKFNAQFQNAHPKWVAEIEDAMNLNIFQRSKDIVENLGVLSLLIFTRLFIINETYENELKMLEKNKKEIKNSGKIWTENLIDSCEQMSFSNQQKKNGVPCMTQNFLIHIAQRIINIVHFEENKNSYILDKIKNNLNSTTEKNQALEEQLLKNLQEIKDKVFPPIEEIYYCIKNKLVNKKETIVYKMLIDFNEALLSGSTSYNIQITQNTFQQSHEEDIQKRNNVFIPCTIKFYKNLNESEISALVMKMEELNTKIFTQNEIENRIEKLKQQIHPNGSILSNPFKQALSMQQLNIFQQQNILSSSSYDDQITQIVLNPVQYFLKEIPLCNQSLGSQIFCLKKLLDQDCYSYSKKIVKYKAFDKQGTAEQRVFVVLHEKQEFLNYYQYMQINIRNQTFNLKSKKSYNNLEQLLSQKSRKSFRNICQQIEPVDSFQDRKVNVVANKQKMPWNKKKNVLMHNGSYFLKNILV